MRVGDRNYTQIGVVDIPDIAFAPDIKGVCSVEGTLVINSTPKNMDKTNIKIKRMI